MVEQRNNIAEIKFTVIVGTTHVSVSFYDRHRKGSVEADVLGPKWSICRAVIHPTALRGRGLGSQMLRKLQDLMVEYGGEYMVVFPGGYDQEHDRQENFYLKNGFQKREKGGLIWRPKKRSM